MVLFLLFCCFCRLLLGCWIVFSLGNELKLVLCLFSGANMIYFIFSIRELADQTGKKQKKQTLKLKPKHE